MTYNLGMKILSESVKETVTIGRELSEKDSEHSLYEKL
jgi:hypothetical protein